MHYIYRPSLKIQWQYCALYFQAVSKDSITILCIVFSGRLSEDLVSHNNVHCLFRPSKDSVTKLCIIFSGRLSKHLVTILCIIIILKPSLAIQSQYCALDFQAALKIFSHNTVHYILQAVSKDSVTIPADVLWIGFALAVNAVPIAFHPHWQELKRRRCCGDHPPHWPRHHARDTNWGRARTTWRHIRHPSWRGGGVVQTISVSEHLVTE